ncbi:MAG: hypothetical protein GC202_02390 [Alphaproteobacteria bacterium]|nr:hypothetical protein [Alphaproteobacteria bacterium]
MAELPPHPSIATVRSFLDAMEAGDVEKARGHVSRHARFILPGGGSTASLDDIVRFVGQRYRTLTKRIERFDRVEMDGDDIVFCTGTLTGAWEDGAPFEGVRFVDRFVIRGGVIVLHEIWNDADEARSRRPAPPASSGDRAVLAMASEINRLRDRLGNLERLLAAKGILSQVEIEAHGIDDAETIPEDDPLGQVGDFLGVSDDDTHR